MCTSPPECFSISAQQSTRSCTTSCQHALEKCSRRSCAIGHIPSLPENIRSVSPGWRSAVPWVTRRSATELLLLRQKTKKWEWNMRPVFLVKNKQTHFMTCYGGHIKRDLLVLSQCIHQLSSTSSLHRCISKISKIVLSGRVAEKKCTPLLKLSDRCLFWKLNP